MIEVAMIFVTHNLQVSHYISLDLICLDALDAPARRWRIQISSY